MLELSGGTFRAESQTLTAAGDLGVAVVRLTGQRGDRSLDVINAQISRFENDRIVEVRDTSSDLDAIDRYFS